MLAGLLVTLVLALALCARRSNVLELAGASAWREHHPRWLVLLGAILALGTSAPIWSLAPGIGGYPPTFWADDSTHARVASEIVAHGLPHGWIDSYFTGFPVGHHYPMGGWLILSALIRLGCNPELAASLVGWAGVALVPLAIYLVAIQAGARPLAALAGAAFVAWVAPDIAFVTSYETHFSLGLISQVVGTMAAVAMAGATVATRRTWPAPIAAAITMACHPQIAVATGFLLGVALLVSGDRAACGRGLRAGVALGFSGAALYGQGISTLGVPFGWPPHLGWRHIGFPPKRLYQWLIDGDLFDNERAVPVLTAVVAATLLSTLLRPGRPVARAATATAVVAIPFSVSGPALAQLGGFGQALLSVLQPLRFSCLLPLVAATVIVVAVEESTPVVTALAQRWRPRAARFLTVAPGIVACLILLAAVPARLQWARIRADHLASLASHPCGADTPRGYDRQRLRAQLGSLEGGRLWYNSSQQSPVQTCVIKDGLDASSAVPVAYTAGAGAHVGVIWDAMSALHPEQEGSDRRAETLSVRYLLLNSNEQAAPGWRLRQDLGGIQLYEHPHPVDRVGVGCIKEIWSGGDRQLRERIHNDLKSREGATRLLDPERLTALLPSAGPLVVTEAAKDHCSATNARISVHPREPGAIAATVELKAPADVVLRATAFPTWKVTVDGQSAKTQMIAPGFFATRVAGGRHEVVALVSLLPGYWLALILGAMGVAAASTPCSAWKAFTRFVRRRSRTHSPDRNPGSEPPKRPLTDG